MREWRGGEGCCRSGSPPLIHLGAGESPGRGWGAQVPRASFLSSPLPHRSGPAEMGGGAHRAGRPPPPPPRFLRLCCRCARAPRLPHCGSRGPINRESDVLRSREWRGPGSWGRGRAEPQAPAPPPPGHVSWAPGSHPQSLAEGLCPLGSCGSVLRPRLLGVTWECTGGNCALVSDRPGGSALHSDRDLASYLPLGPSVWSSGIGEIYSQPGPETRDWANYTGGKRESVRSRGPLSPESNGGSGLANGQIYAPRTVFHFFAEVCKGAGLHPYLKKCTEHLSLAVSLPVSLSLKCFCCLSLFHSYIY